MAEPDIRVLVGVEGGGSVDGESGKQILRDLTSIANTISSKKEIKVAVDLDQTETQKNFIDPLKKMLQNAIKIGLSGVGGGPSLDIGVAFDTKEGSKTIISFKEDVNRVMESVRREVANRVAEINNLLGSMSGQRFDPFRGIQNGLDEIHTRAVQVEQEMRSVTSPNRAYELSVELTDLDDAVQDIRELADLRSSIERTGNELKTFLGSIDGNEFQNVEQDVRDCEREVDALQQTLANTTDRAGLDTLNEQMNALVARSRELRQNANLTFNNTRDPSNTDFDFDLQTRTLEANAERYIEIADRMLDSASFESDRENIEGYRESIVNLIRSIDAVGSANDFVGLRNQIDDAGMSLIRLQNIDIANFFKKIEDARTLLNSLGDPKYSNLIGAWERDERYSDAIDDINEFIGLRDRINTENQNYFGQFLREIPDISSLMEILQRLGNAYQIVFEARKTMNQSVSISNSAIQERKNYETLILSMQRYYETYEQSIRQVPEIDRQFRDLMHRANTPGSFNNAKELSLAFTSLKREAQAAGVETESLFQKLRKLFGSDIKSTVVLGAIGALKSGLRETVQHVINIDTAMTELRKVSDASSNTLAEYFERARVKAAELGAEITTVIEATANFSRLGYNLEDSEKLGEWATIFTNVADDIEGIDEASQAIISTMAAFGVEAENVDRIIDKFNEVGNTQPISSGNLAEALQRSASALAEAGNSMDESIALITAGNVVTQDPLSVGKSLCRR